MDKSMDLDRLMAEEKANSMARSRKADAVNVADQVERFAMAIKDGVTPEEQAYMAGVLEGMMGALRMMKVTRDGQKMREVRSYADGSVAGQLPRVRHAQPAGESGGPAGLVASAASEQRGGQRDAGDCKEDGCEIQPDGVREGTG